MNITIENTGNGDNTFFALALINLDGQHFVFRSGIKQSGAEARNEVFSYLSLIY